MIIQKVAKGIAVSSGANNLIQELSQTQPWLTQEERKQKEIEIIIPEVQKIFDHGIVCSWLLNAQYWPQQPTTYEISRRLTDENLRWHQNLFDKNDPVTKQPFYLTTPFISTTAGTVERRTFFRKNQTYTARDIAHHFATDKGREAGIVFYCYVFIIGKKAVGHISIAEELRELNIYTNWSRFHPEGEITAKIIIPPAQIERAEIWIQSEARNLQPSKILKNSSLYLEPRQYDNIRELL